MKKYSSIVCSVFLSLILIGCSNTGVFESADLNDTSVSSESVTEIASHTVSEDISIETTQAGMIIPTEYYDVIDSIVDYIENFDPNNESTYIGGEYGGGVFELCSYDYPCDLVAFAFVDIDGDNTAEMAILACDDFGYEYRIIDLYTFYDGQVKHVIGGGVRSRFYLTNDMTIYNEGSAGASYTITSRYEFDDETHELSFVDSYYTLAAFDVGLGDEGGVLCYTTNELYVLSTDTDSPYVEIIETFDTYPNVLDEYGVQETNLYDYGGITTLAEYSGNNQ